MSPDIAFGVKRTTMYKIFGIAVMLAIAGFAVFWPFDKVYAVFAFILALLHGAWAWNSKDLHWRLAYIAMSVAMGFLGIFSMSLGVSPGAGTLVFGSGTPYLKLTLEIYGAGQAQFPFYLLSFAFAPGLIGAVLARVVNRRIRTRNTIPGTPDMPISR
jgi:hypothetical protein